MVLDRAYQLELLKMMAESYPHRFDSGGICRGMDKAAEKKYIANICYLAGHGLIACETSLTIKGHLSIGTPKITEKGLDFLADDGGLTAILGVTTIRFEADQLREILESKIIHAPIPSASKTEILATLRGLPAEAIKSLTKKLLDEGLAALPDAARIIQTHLHTLF